MRTWWVMKTDERNISEVQAYILYLQNELALFGVTLERVQI
jgi:hypothetical protein